MSSSNSPRTVFLAAIDNSPAAARVAAAAARFRVLSGSEVHLVHVVPRLEGQSIEARVEPARSLLERTCEAAGLGSDVMLHIQVGAAWREIVQLAANLHADVIIVGTHDRGLLSRVVLGSVAEEVMRKAGCPVYIARDTNHAAVAPEIEPPCVACVDTQRRTHGRALWCDRHTQRHAHGRLHYDATGVVEGGGTSLIRV